MANSDRPMRVVVTGGNGFLGQHIVKLLQEKSVLNIREVIVFDLVEFKQGLDYSPRFKMASFVGDIANLDDVKECLKNADAVIHSCSLISVGIFPENDKLNLINVQGTRNIIEACVSNGVTSLVYTSTEDVIMGPEFVTNGDESLPYPCPGKFRYDEYGRTKCEAEKMVLAADKTILKNGTQLRTAAIRPDTFFGELDKLFVTTAIETARTTFGYLPHIGAGVQPCSYVGNTAWGHVKALETLHYNPDRAGGEAFFIVDDTPHSAMTEIFQPFLESRGYKLTPFRIPFWITFPLIVLFQIIANLIVPIYKINSVLNYKIVSNLYNKHWFTYSKATEFLGYKPIYSYEESVSRSRKYYDSL